MGLVKEYLARTKDRDKGSDALSISWTMDRAVAVINVAIMNLHKDALALVNIRVFGDPLGRLPYLLARGL